MDKNHKPLLGVKVFVDVRSKHANHSTAVSEELRKLGAVVLDKLLPTVTHIIFKDGSKTTEARGNKFGAHIVNVSWVDSCKQANDRVPEHLHSIKTASNKKKQRSMQPKDFHEEVKQASDKLARVKKRRSDVQIPSPLTIVADRINMNNYISAPRTPPAMQKRLEQLRLKASSNKSNLATSTNKTPVSTLQPMLTNDLGMSPTLRPSQKEPSMAVGPSYTSKKVVSQRDIIVPETPLQWNIKSAQTLQFSPTPNKAAAESSNMVLCTPVTQQHKVEEAVPPILDLSGSLSPTLDWDDSIESFLNVKLNASDNLFTPPSPTRDQSTDNLSVNQTSNSIDASKSVAYNDEASANEKAVDSDSVARLQQKLVDRTIESVSSNENGSFSVIKPPLPRRSTGGANTKGPKKSAVTSKRRSSFVPPRPVSDKTEKVLDKKKIDDDVVGSLLSAHSKAMKSSQQLLGNLSQDNSRDLSKPASNTSLFSAFSKLKPARMSGFIPPIKSNNDNVKESQEIPLFNQVVPETPKENSGDKLASTVLTKSDTTSHISVKSDKSTLSIITLSDSETENSNLTSTAKENQPKTNLSKKSVSKLVSQPVMGTNPKRRSLSVKRKPLTAVIDHGENDMNFKCSDVSLTTEMDATSSSSRRQSKAIDKTSAPDTSNACSILSDPNTKNLSSDTQKSKARRKSSVVNRKSVSALEEKNKNDASIHSIGESFETDSSSSRRESEAGNDTIDPDMSNATSVLSDLSTLNLTNDTKETDVTSKSRRKSTVVNKKSLSNFEVESKKDPRAQNIGEAKSVSSCRKSKAMNETTDQEPSYATSDASMAHQSVDSIRSAVSSKSRSRMSAASSSLLSDATPSSARRSKRMSLMATPSKELQMSHNSIEESSGLKGKTSTVSDSSSADMSLLTPRRSKRLSILPTTSERPSRAPSANTTSNSCSADNKGPSKGRKSASETSKDTSSKASRSRSRDQVVPNSSMASMSSELTDFHSPAFKPKNDRQASTVMTELPPTPDTSNSRKPSAKRRRQSSVVTEASVESYSGKKDNLAIDDKQPVTKRRKTILSKGSASVKKPLAELNTASKVSTVPKGSIAKPKETLNWINFSKTENDKRFHNNSISSQSELDEDAVWMFNSPPSTPAEPNSSINEVPSTTKSPTVNSRVGRITEKENRPGISSDVVKKKPVKGLEIGDYRNTGKNSNIVLTSLHSGDRTMVKSIVKSLGGYDISTEVNHKTTHVVCGDGRRTMNVLQGMSQGCWIVSVEWILSSLGADQWLTNEEDFLMTDAFRGATKQRRRHILGQSNKLFATIGQIYVSPGTKPPQDDLISLVHLNGGKVAKTRRASKIVVGRECDTSKNRSVIREAWILDCVTAQRLLDYKPYKWRLPSDSSSSDCEDNDMLHNIFSS